MKSESLSRLTASLKSLPDRAAKIHREWLCLNCEDQQSRVNQISWVLCEFCKQFIEAESADQIESAKTLIPLMEWVESNKDKNILLFELGEESGGVYLEALMAYVAWWRNKS